MSNRRQFVHQTAAALLVCGFIASLLPGFPAAQDSSDKPPVQGRADSPTSGQAAIPGGGGLPEMPMTAPVENSLAYEVAQKPALESKLLSDMESLDNWNGTRSTGRSLTSKGIKSPRSSCGTGSRAINAR
jgi:hypothetical protein